MESYSESYDGYRAETENLDAIDNEYILIALATYEASAWKRDHKYVAAEVRKTRERFQRAKLVAAPF
jgi:hypothetical protein